MIVFQRRTFLKEDEDHTSAAARIRDQIAKRAAKEFRHGMYGRKSRDRCDSRSTGRDATLLARFSESGHRDAHAVRQLDPRSDERSITERKWPSRTGNGCGCESFRLPPTVELGFSGRKF